MSLQVDSEWESVAKQPATSPDAAVCGTNMCYIIFTSGSTGRPKGTVLQHAGVINYLHCLAECAARPQSHCDLLSSKIRSRKGFDWV